MSDYKILCQDCGKPIGEWMGDFCPKCDGKRVADKLVEEFKWNLLNWMGPPGINECAKHHKKEWISKNCPYCALAEAESKLKDARNEIKRLKAIEMIRSNCEMKVTKFNAECKGGKY
jgi:hypothetical protein